MYSSLAVCGATTRMQRSKLLAGPSKTIFQPQTQRINFAIIFLINFIFFSLKNKTSNPSKKVTCKYNYFIDYNLSKIDC